MRLAAAIIAVAAWSTGLQAQSFDAVAAHESLLSQATGYFDHAGGTGGQGGTVVYVTNLNDSGSGSLREALTTSEPLIILFEDGLEGTIRLVNGISIRSNKTLWGRHRDGTAADIYIDPNPNERGLDVENGNRNVIFANLKGDASGPNDSAPDFISVRETGEVVWVHHVTAFGDGSDDMDGFVDIRGDYVTVSWCRVTGWAAVHLINPKDGLPSRVTFHHNLWRDSRDRMPRTASIPARAHVYNNWLAAWRNYGVNGTTGEIFVENNVFDAAGSPDAIRGTWGGSGNVFTGGARASTPQTVFAPPYSYVLEDVSTDAAAQALRDNLEANAGWRSSFDDVPVLMPPQNLQVTGS